MGGVRGVTRRVSTPAIVLGPDVEGLMLKIVLLITATALFLCSVDVGRVVHGLLATRMLRFSSYPTGSED